MGATVFLLASLQVCTIVLMANVYVLILDLLLSNREEKYIFP